MGTGVLQIKFQIIDDILLVEELERVSQVHPGYLTFDIDIHTFKYRLIEPASDRWFGQTVGLAESGSEAKSRFQALLERLPVNLDVGE
ncbi:MAG TPA: hypothetical protein VGG09_00750 [Acidimicrobiales bacterium]